MRSCLASKSVIGESVIETSATGMSTRGLLMRGMLLTAVVVAVLLAEGCGSPGAADSGAGPADSATSAGTPEASAPEGATPAGFTGTGSRDPGAGESAGSTTRTPGTGAPETTTSNQDSPSAGSPAGSPGVVSAEPGSAPGTRPGGAQIDDANPVNASADETPTASKVPRAQAALLSPSLASDTAPDLFKVKFSTTKGDFILEVHRDWAPNGADRLYNLAKIGFFNDVAFFRVMKNFVVQFGIHGDPEVSAAWIEASIPDDPVSEATSNTRGMVSFADRRSADTRTTQLFINLAGMNSFLDEEGYAPVGEVIEGMNVVDSLYSGYGEGAPRGSGPSQAAIQSQGNEYLKRDFPKLDYIESASIIE